MPVQPTSRLGFARVHGASMEPTLRDGDRLLVRHGAPPRIGRLAVVLLPERAAGRGQVVAVKRVVRREPDGWWVERDNPGAGVDSWTVGSIPDDAVVARVLCRVWPPRRPVRRRGTSAPSH